MKNNYKLQQNLWGYVFILPMLIGTLIFFFFALFFSIFISFTEWNPFNGEFKMVGFKNYIDIFSNNMFLASLWNTIKYVIIRVPLGIFISLVLALMIYKNKIIGENYFKTIYYIPTITLPIALSYVWKYIFGTEYGLINGILGSIGISKIQWLATPNLAMFTIILYIVWSSSGYGMLIYLSGLSSIDKNLYEAADMEGASSIQKILYITIPMLSPTTFFLLTTTIIATFQIFDPIYAITNGGPNNGTRTLMFMVYTEGFQNFRLGPASAISWVLFIIIAIVTVIQFKLQKRWVYYD